MEMYRGKIFNEEVFEQYTKKLPSTRENSLIKNGLFKNVNKYRAKFASQTGGYAIVEPIKGRIGGNPVNYDGNTDIPKGSERDTFYQRKIAYGRANSWGEYDFSADITNENFMAEAQEVRDYWDEQRQSTVLSILKGIFSMSGGVDGQFVSKHTYDITSAVTPTLGADSMNRAMQKALGDKKGAFDMVFTHSMVSTNLEGLNLIDFLKYTDSDGIEKELTIGQYNGKYVVVDDEMPTEDVVTTAPVYSMQIKTPAVAGDKITIGATEFTFVANDTDNPTATQIKVGAGGTASQQATNIAAAATYTGFTITSSTDKVLFTAASGTNPDEPAIDVTQKAEDGALVVEVTNSTPAVFVTNYTSYIFKKGFFEYEDLGLVDNKAIELARDPYDKGGKNDLISRIREIIVPMYISYKGNDAISPTSNDFENGSNWELVNNAKTGSSKVYVDNKLIPLARIISRG